jgi:cell division protein FtsL
MRDNNKTQVIRIILLMVIVLALLLFIATVTAALVLGLVWFPYRTRKQCCCP